MKIGAIMTELDNRFDSGETRTQLVKKAFCFDSIPQGMKVENRWVVIKASVNGCVDKRPICAKNINMPAKVNDPQTWSSFQEAVGKVDCESWAYGQKGIIVGIGFMLGNGWAMVDIDGGQGHNGMERVSDEVFSDVDQVLNTYGEHSTGGQGYHFYMRYSGEKLAKCRKGTFEIYTENRFGIVTGWVCSRVADVADATKTLKLVFEKYMDEDTRRGDRMVLDDMNTLPRGIVTGLQADMHFESLWSGTYDRNQYGSASQSDLALMGKLVKYVGKDEAVKQFIKSPYAKCRQNPEKLLRSDYLERTLNQACKGNVNGQMQEKQRLTIELLKHELDRSDIHLRYDNVTMRIDIDAVSDTGRRLQFGELVTRLYSELGGRYTDKSRQTISQYLVYLAQDNMYNPVIEYINSITWDGQDRIKQLMNLCGISDVLSQVLLRKWLYQTMAILFNRKEQPFGLDGVLVLNGGQGIGKTSVLRKLALKPEWFGEGKTISDYDKDTKRRVITTWIAELGQVESTLKSDVSALKAFVTDSIDAYRLPYARTDTISPRHTSLAATCNSEEYLLDTTGNRRWWTVQMSHKINYEDIVAFNAQQLWAQIHTEVSGMTYEQKAQCFRLTSEQRDQLQKRNSSFIKPVKGQVQVQDILAKAKDETQFEWMTISQFKSQHDPLRNYSAQQIGVALKACNICQRRTKNSREYLLPCYQLDMPF